ncbi:DUF2997 domain-containing protein [Caldilinea sp.]|uniref:DUF2997 domain-containing protein n=1 Tax=Caldilinea sp. TaxID=2293560 RepID=UPI00262F73EE|nr:DUF2997 domain-containing protein [uncultured Caldilinea sp.]
MQSQEIEITILPDGRVEYTIKGVKGAGCETISALLEQLGKVEQVERTGEYYEDEAHVDVTVSGS